MSSLCANCNVSSAVTDTVFKQCSRCKAVLYCSRQCQLDAWKLHKSSCKPPASSPLETANNYNNIGNELQKKGKYDEALVSCGKAHKIIEQELGEFHTSTGMSYNNIGNVLELKKDYDGALVAHRKALAIFQNAPGETYLTAMSHNNIGLVLYASLQYDDALIECRKALAIYNDSIGDHRADISKCNKSILNIQRDQIRHNKTDNTDGN